MNLLQFKGARTAKKLNCKSGNYQCGGKCQNNKFNCPSEMSPEDKKAYEKAKRAARKNKKIEEAKEAVKAIKSEQKQKLQVSEVSAEDFIKDGDFGKTFEVPPEILSEMESGRLGSVAKSEAGLARKSALEDDPTKPQRYADEINYLRSFNTENPSIKTQEDFEKAFDEAFDSLNTGDNEVMIHLIRRRLRGQINREDFDRYFFERVKRDENFVPRGGSIPSGDPYERLDSVANSNGSLRVFIKKF